VDNSSVLYGITSAYSPSNAHSIRYSDPALNISWPIPIGIVSRKDAEGLSFAEAVKVSMDQK
jgi:dTDP-4-dehydrorhamnose 3,5-epimerase